VRKVLRCSRQQLCRLCKVTLRRRKPPTRALSLLLRARGLLLRGAHARVARRKLLLGALKLRFERSNLLPVRLPARHERAHFIAQLLELQVQCACGVAPLLLQLGNDVLGAAHERHTVPPPVLPLGCKRDRRSNRADDHRLDFGGVEACDALAVNGRNAVARGKAALGHAIHPLDISIGPNLNADGAHRARLGEAHARAHLAGGGEGLCEVVGEE